MRLYKTWIQKRELQGNSCCLELFPNVDDGLWDTEHLQVAVVDTPVALLPETPL